MKTPIIPGHYRTVGGTDAWIAKPPEGVPLQPRQHFLVGWYMTGEGAIPATWSLTGDFCLDGVTKSHMDLAVRLPDDQYPTVTEGSVLAAEARAQANKLTAEERQVFSKLAQRLIEECL